MRPTVAYHRGGHPKLNEFGIQCGVCRHGPCVADFGSPANDSSSSKMLQEAANSKQNKEKGK